MSVAAPEVERRRPSGATTRRRRPSATGIERDGRATSAALPVILGMVVITIVFTAKNSNFLTAVNFNNLIVQMAGTTVIAIGVVFVLLLGEIDLSIGYVSGVAGVVRRGAASSRARATSSRGSSRSCSRSLARRRDRRGCRARSSPFIGVPSFVVTLAGLPRLAGRDPAERSARRA